MKKFALALILTILSLSNVHMQTSPDNILKARRFIELLSKGETAKAENFVGDEMKAKISEGQLGKIWRSLAPRFGSFRNLSKAKKQNINGFEVITLSGEFEKINVNVIISFDKAGMIQGFFLKPIEVYKTPNYAKPELFENRKVNIGSGEFSLPGNLMIPKSKKESPVVIIVHGSGPNDRDGTHVNSANKPYKDLALGLASKGVAALRYEKWTKQYGSKLAKVKSLTVKDEVIDDVILAVELLRKTEGINAKKIYVLGHSLGGYLIPRINKRSKNIEGFISFAGATQHLEDVYLEQNRYFAKLDGKISKEEQEKLNELKQIALKIKSLTVKDLDSSEFYLGAYSAYWIDLQKYEPPKEAKSIRKPFLILQGERDYQVTMVDFKNWKKELEGKESVTFRSYPKLNHIFMSGEGIPSPADYSKTNHVAEKVIDDIVHWILQLKK